MSPQAFLQSSTRNSSSRVDLDISPEFLQKLLWSSLKKVFRSYASKSLWVSPGIPLEVLQDFFQSSLWNLFGVSPGNSFEAPPEFFWVFAIVLPGILAKFLQSSSSNSLGIFRNTTRNSPGSLDILREILQSFSRNSFLPDFLPTIPLNSIQRFLGCSSGVRPGIAPRFFH